MSHRRSFVTIAGTTALVLGVALTTPAAAATNDAVARAIVTTVLTNLGVDPSPELVDRLVASIPLDELNKKLVGSVGTALDEGKDASSLIGTAVDSDGDGIPNPNSVSSDDGEDDNSDDQGEDSPSESGSGTSTGSSSAPSSSSKPSDTSDDDDESDDSADNTDDDSSKESGEDD